MKRRVLAKTTPFHTLLKKNPKQSRFERHYSLYSSPGRAENRGIRKLCSPVSHRLLFPRGPKKTPKKHLTCLNTDRWPTTNAKKQRGQTLRWRWGSCTEAAPTALPYPLTGQRQAISPPFSSY